MRAVAAIVALLSAVACLEGASAVATSRKRDTHHRSLRNKHAHGAHASHHALKHHSLHHAAAAEHAATQSFAQTHSESTHHGHSSAAGKASGKSRSAAHGRHTGSVGGLEGGAGDRHSKHAHHAHSRHSAGLKTAEKQRSADSKTGAPRFRERQGVSQHSRHHHHHNTRQQQKQKQKQKHEHHHHDGKHSGASHENGHHKHARADNSRFVQRHGASHSSATGQQFHSRAATLGFVLGSDSAPAEGSSNALGASAQSSGSDRVAGGRLEARASVPQGHTPALLDSSEVGVALPSLSSSKVAAAAAEQEADARLGALGAGPEAKSPGDAESLGSDLRMRSMAAEGMKEAPAGGASSQSFFKRASAMSLRLKEAGSSSDKAAEPPTTTTDNGIGSGIPMEMRAPAVPDVGDITAGFQSASPARPEAGSSIGDLSNIAREPEMHAFEGRDDSQPVSGVDESIRNQPPAAVIEMV